MTAPLLALALAAAPDILLPPWPLAPDGESVAVVGGARLEARGAAVEPVAPGLWQVVPVPGARTVVLRAGGREVEAAVEPPPGTVAITVATPAPVKGQDPAVEIGLAVLRADGTPDDGAPPPVVSVSAGKVRELAPAGPGRFRAVFEPASTLHPDVAVLLALVPRCPLCATPRAVGYAVLPVSAAVNLPGESDPGTRTTVAVAGRRFGPVTADADGRFRVPVVIPPGAHFAEATTVDDLGNRRETRIDLRLPPIDRLACAGWPPAVPADGRATATVHCVASTEAGQPSPDARLALAATAGTFDRLAPVPGGGALQRARWRAPAGRGAGEAVLVGTYPEGGPASRDEVRVALASGPPAEIVARIAREPAPLGATIPAETAVRDARGDVLGVPVGPPGATVGFVAPDRFVAASSGLWQDAELSFVLAPGRDAATLVLRPVPGGWLAEARTVDGRPVPGLPVAFGGGAHATTDVRGEARVAGAGPRESVTARSGARAVAFAVAPPPPAPFELSRTIRVALRPPTAVDVFATVERGVLRWRIDDERGRPVPARRVVLHAEGVTLGPVEPDGDGGQAAVRGGHGLVAVVDAETGVAAVVEVP
jgi:hypothetical protein